MGQIFVPLLHFLVNRTCMEPIQEQIESINRAIAALEGQRSVLGDAIVETALGPLKEKLAGLQAQPPAEQRKLVTVLFADLVDFTAMSERMDSEEVRDITNAYFKRWTSAIERFGGVVEKFIGDAVMAVFGLKAASEVDAENAVRAALQMRALLNRLEEEGPEDRLLANLRMRVGIHTGPVVVSWLGERKGQDVVVVGDSVNLASRLQSLAPVNGVLISHDTYRHVSGIFNVQAQEPVRVKGKQEPVQAYVVLDEKPQHAFQAGQGIEGVETTMVGRQVELDALQAAYREVLDRRECRVVTILGQAGLGKSRLLLEFDHWLERQAGYNLFQSRSSPAGQNTPYGLLRGLLAYRFGIHDSDSPQVVRQRLENELGEALHARLAGEAPPGTAGEAALQPEARQKTHFIARLLGFEIGASPFLPESDPRQIQERGLAYLGEYFQSLAARGPVVVLLEDLHWSDDSTLDLLPRLARSLRHAPLLVLGSARGALLERQPGWAEELSFAARLNLQPLSQADSERLVREILQKVPDLPPELEALIVRSAEGVPFYVEELIKMLIDDGTIETLPAGWRVNTSRLANIRVPSTLTELLQARFDSLSAREKALLQRAAVVGRTFWDQALAFIVLREANQPATAAGGQPAPSASPEDEAVLGQLQKRELILLRAHSSLEETREFSFKHALQRDVTYESLLKRYRRIYHAHVAQWLEGVVGRSQRADEFAAMIAEHYELAGESGSPLRAAGWYARAARSAGERFANPSAIRLYQRALQLLPEAQVEQRIVLDLALAEKYGLVGDRPHQVELLQGLDELVANLPNTSGAARLAAETRISWSGYYNITGDYPQAVASASQAVRLARSVEDAFLECRGENVWATACRNQSEYAAAREHYLNAERLAKEIGRRGVQEERPPSAADLASLSIQPPRISADLLLAEAHFGLGVVCDVQGEYEQAVQFLQQALQLFRRLNHLMGESRVLNSLGAVSMNLSNHEASRKYLEQALQIKLLVGDRYGQGVTLANLGNVCEMAHKLEMAVVYFYQSLEICREIEDAEGVEVALIGIANNCHSLGNYPRELGALEEALAISRQIGDRQGEAGILISLGELQNLLGQPGAGREYCQQSLQLCEEIGAPNEAGYAWFFLGRSLELLGLAAEAQHAYQRSYQIRQELGQAKFMLDSQAALARTHWMMGASRQALELLGPVVEALQPGGIHSLGQPVQACLTCYRILLPEQPELARRILLWGQEFLLLVTAEIKDEGLRKSYLEGVSDNAELLGLARQA
jgi:class 3 adenylate cyclase/tetratricopeptide (TPR) repeat protein